MSQKTNTLKRGYVKELTKISVLAAVAAVLMLIEFPLFFAPEFYKLDLSEVAVLIGGFALGPIPAVIIEFIKVLLNLALNGTVTGGVGEAANFIIGCSFVLPASIIYCRNKSMKSAIVGMVAGILMMAVVGALANYFVLLPVYAKVFGMPIQVFIDMGNALNSSIVDLKSFILFAVVPFNIVKGIIVSAVTILIYKRISPVLHR
ncbi:Riboflavin transporter FmnP [Dethiosulfatibacter aminovorans DSM 17477]|uniref:Riboflavin transporter n=1 Tax=Dethiosulfatibacter aminovorans DSM 17477 TaxID=1121476 RepID=A0A1M6D185_9FIRM|nr:ECF transporter S component [Dethiosulfatibacter aminovorans]SHI67006.1 Riboflavin transporter FmnP [Dethiosulfatibacter aminovorans DSM 17477]